MCFQKLYDAHYSATLKHAEITSGLKDDQVEQIVIDAFFELHQAMKRGVKIEFIRTFLQAQVNTQAALYARTRGRSRRGGYLVRHELRKIHVSAHFKGFDIIDARDTIASVWRRLNQTEQDVATLVLMGGYKQCEAATKLNLPLRTVERRVRKIKQKLRKLLTPV